VSGGVNWLSFCVRTAHGVEVDEYLGDDDGGVEQNEEVEQHLEWIAVEHSQRLTATSEHHAASAPPAAAYATMSVSVCLSVCL